MTSETYGVSLLAALNHLQIVISDEMGFQVTYVKMEEKWTNICSSSVLSETKLGLIYFGIERSATMSIPVSLQESNWW